MSSTEIEQVELSIEEAKKFIDRKNQLQKLFSNREFRKIVEEGYFKEEAARLAALTGEVNPAVKDHRDEIILELQAISKLQQYFRNIIIMGNTMEESIQEHRETLEVLREEESA